jgi:hypothetical protein
LGKTKRYNDKLISLIDTFYNNKSVASDLDALNISRLEPLPSLIDESSIDICVLGMNPSHSDKGYRSIGLDSSDNIFTYQGPDFFNDKLERLIDIQKVCYVKHPYFKQIKSFIESISKSSKVEFLDFLPIRHTNQKDIEKIIDLHPEATMSLLNHTVDYLVELKPQLILVLNARGARLIRDVLARSTEFEILQIAPAVDNVTSKSTSLTILYSGMITGGRMDTFSRERLAHQISIFLK